MNEKAHLRMTVDIDVQNAGICPQKLQYAEYNVVDITES
jgi:hypothetical protein